MKILRALFVSNNKGKRFPFLTKNEVLFVWYVLVSYSRTFRKLGKLLFLKCHEDFDYTEIDCMVRIEICLSNDSKSVVRFQQQREALFVSITTNVWIQRNIQVEFLTITDVDT